MRFPTWVATAGFWTCAVAVVLQVFAINLMIAVPWLKPAWPMVFGGALCAVAGAFLNYRAMPR